MAIEKIGDSRISEQALPAREPEKITRPEKGRFEFPWFENKKAKPAPAKIMKTEVAPVPIPTIVPAWQAKRAQEIDTILSEGLNEIFLDLKPEEQATFKKKGEETVLKISGLLSHTRLRVGKIIALIRDWLKLIPGINRFFLEQEAKIKADKILKLKDR